MKKTLSIEVFSEKMPFAFKDGELLKKVFVHRSFLNEREGCALKESNERLEFLGDAVLSNVISHMLYARYPEIDEGELTRLRAKLVNRQTLARLAKSLSLDEHVLLGKGEHGSGGRQNPSILAGVFEALIAAVYIEAGFDGVTSYIEGLFAPVLNDILIEPGHFDHKPRLQELSQRVFRTQPVYRLVKEEGPPHKRTFEVEVLISGEVMGDGKAAKKKDAEQSAALQALKKLEELCVKKGDVT